MDVKFSDISRIHQPLKSQFDKVYNRIFEESSFIGGNYLNEFESKFKKLFKCDYFVPVSNGTDSIYMILRALGISSGDEVITVTNTWISTSETITMTGANPVFVDCDEYHTIDASKIENKITSKTKAIIAVHLYGQSCDMDQLNLICQKHKLHLIEDCAQSHLSEYKNTIIGNFGIASSFSFYPGKNLGAFGDAGGIICKDKELYTKIKMLANHGALTKHNHEIEGTNSRMNNFQAGILSVKIDHLQNWTDQRRSIAESYSELLKDVNQIELPKIRKNSKHSFHLYVIKAKRRDELFKYLTELNIQVLIHYPRILPNTKAYEYLNSDMSEFPLSLKNEELIISLPVFPEMRDDEINYVVDCIKNFYEKSK